jgi:dTDP-4-dehydrorhamnose 3,5-epimerase
MLRANDFLKSAGGLGAPIDLDSILVFQHSPNSDSRGEFTRIFDVGLISEKLGTQILLSQISYSGNVHVNTRRGLHLRRLPELEMKCVRVIQGKILDLVLDCRPESESFGSWAAFELSAKTGDGIIVPGGFAHGMQTLVERTALCYGMNLPFNSMLDLAINTDDSDLGIRWPTKPSNISEKDKNGMAWGEYVGLINGPVQH